MGEIPKLCGTCKYWAMSLRGVVGECEVEIETKVYNHSCSRWEIGANKGDLTKDLTQSPH